MLAVVDARDLPAGQRQAAYDEVVAWAKGQAGVEDAQVVRDNQAGDNQAGDNEAGDGAQVMITPTTGPDEVATEDLLQALRDGQAGIEQATGTTLGVTGLTAITVDVSERLNDALPI